MQSKNKQLLRRIFAVTLAMTMVFTLSACGDRGSSSSSSSEESSSMESVDPPVESAEPSKPEQGVLDKIAANYNKNSDTVGWLRFPDTNIDNVVLQGDDNVFYERRDETKAYNWYGCYYADAGNSFGTRSDLSHNTIIYGHNMHNTTDGPKFGELQKLVDFDGDGVVSVKDDQPAAKDLTFAKEHPYIYFSTADDDMVWVIYAAYFTDLNFEYHLENPSDEVFAKMVKEAKERSRINYDVDVRTGDKILTLSTCAYKYDNARRDQRFVVQARLLRAGESPEDVIQMTKNDKPKEPQFS